MDPKNLYEKKDEEIEKKEAPGGTPGDIGGDKGATQGTPKDDDDLQEEKKDVANQGFEEP